MSDKIEKTISHLQENALYAVHGVVELYLDSRLPFDSALDVVTEIVDSTRWTTQEISERSKK